MSRIETERLLVPGPAGDIEVAIDAPAHPLGLALIAHPHPLFGGTMDNKVVTTLVRAFNLLGYAAVRAHFRGVGRSAGTHDHGEGETEDLLAVLGHVQARFGATLPVALAGFSFGAYVQTRLAKRLAEQGRQAERLVLVGTAAGFIEGTRSYETEAVPGDTLVIHGEVDETVPLANVLAWARPLDLPVVVVPGADHFFHRKLHLIRNIVVSSWRHG